jgi:hypothetical protein
MARLLPRNSALKFSKFCPRLWPILCADLVKSARNPRAIFVEILRNFVRFQCFIPPSFNSPIKRMYAITRSRCNLFVLMVLNRNMIISVTAYYGVTKVCVLHLVA